MLIPKKMIRFLFLRKAYVTVSTINWFPLQHSLLQTLKSVDVQILSKIQQHLHVAWTQPSVHSAPSLGYLQ